MVNVRMIAPRGKECKKRLGANFCTTLLLLYHTKTSGATTCMMKIDSCHFKRNKKPAWDEKCCLLFSHISFCSRDIQGFKICKLAKWWRHTLNQIWSNMMEKIYLSQFVSEMFDSVQYSTKCALQFQLTSFVTMATYWVPDLPNINSNSGHLWCSIFIFANGASSPWSNKHLNMLAWVCGLVKRFSSWKSLTYWNQVGGDWKRLSCHGNKMFYSRRCVFCRIISLPSFNGLHCKLAKIALFINLM